MVLIKTPLHMYGSIESYITIPHIMPCLEKSKKLEQKYKNHIQLLNKNFAILHVIFWGWPLRLTLPNVVY